MYILLTRSFKYVIRNSVPYSLSLYLESFTIFIFTNESRSDQVNVPGGAVGCLARILGGGVGGAAQALIKTVTQFKT